MTHAKDNLRHKYYVIGNWKMYLSHEEQIKWTEDVDRSIVKSSDSVEVVICPSHLSLLSLKNRDLDLAMGAQNCSYNTKGAHTGQVSPSDLADIGCKYVIVGHSEVRAQLHDTDEIVNLKIKKSIEVGLIPVVCVGESEESNANGLGKRFVQNQLNAVFDGVVLGENGRVIIAYEPVWAIYPSKQTVSPQHVHEMVELVHETVSPLLKNAHQYSVIYGGSVTGKNVGEYMDLPGVVGVLPGHASTDPVEFANIIECVNRVR